MKRHLKLEICNFHLTVPLNVRRILSMKSMVLALCIGIMVLGYNVSWAANPGDVVISELMWMGSTLSDADEWIELRNTTGSDIDLNNWDITRKSGEDEVLMLTIPAGKTILAGGYFLISNYDAKDSKINVSPDLVATAVSLANNQLQIKLYDGPWETTGNLIDTADDGTGAPAKGDSDNKYSMVRGPAPGDYTPGDGTLADNWHTADRAFGWDPGATERGTPGNDNALPVTFSYFEARYVDNVVILRWITESETNNLGFEVYRAESKDGPFTKINSHRIDGAGTTANQHKYEYTDDTAVAGNQYFYYIENIDFSGEKDRSETIQAMSGPFGKEKPSVFSKPSVLGQPVEFQVFQNFPNPFNPETWIPFQLPESTDVTVKIYNVFGQVVRIIDVGQKGIGRYLSKDESIHWDGRNQNGELVPSGVYFYQFRAGKFIAMKKMLLVK
jgi:hypothetical protein